MHLRCRCVSRVEKPPRNDRRVNPSVIGVRRNRQYLLAIDVRNMCPRVVIGSRGRLKICCPHGRTGSSPVAGTTIKECPRVVTAAEVDLKSAARKSVLVRIQSRAPQLNITGTWYNQEHAAFARPSRRSITVCLHQLYWDVAQWQSVRLFRGGSFLGKPKLKHRSKSGNAYP